MASLRIVAQEVFEEAKDGIAWIALYKQGRGWGAACFWVMFDEKKGIFDFDADDLESLNDILSTDQNAVLANGYYSNLGSMENMTRASLYAALRWQYEGQFSRLADILAEEWKEPQTTDEPPAHPAAVENNDSHSEKIDSQSGLDELLAYICDTVCKENLVIRSQDEMDDICTKCRVRSLAETINVKGPPRKQATPNEGGQHPNLVEHLRRERKCWLETKTMFSRLAQRLPDEGC